MINMDEIVTEEYNVWARAIASTDAATILLIVFWIGLFFLRWEHSISEQTLKEMVLYSGIITPLLKKIRD